MKKALFFVSMCICFVSTLFIGGTSSDAKIYIEGNQDAYVRFTPQISEDNSFSILDGENKWTLGWKTNSFSEHYAFYVEPNRIGQFDKYELDGSVYRIFTNDYSSDYPDKSDLMGYVSIDTENESEVTISSTRTENRINDEYSESAKPVFASTLGKLTYIANDMIDSLMGQNKTNVHPVLKFDAAFVEGDSTSNFTVGMNMNYSYYREKIDTRNEIHQVFNQDCHSYGEFTLPFPVNYPDPTKIFFDVDSDSLNVPTTYKFRNLRVALERFVPLNTAEYEELLLLDGIGQVLAQRIIDYRQENNEIKSIDDLQKIKGIGPVTVQKIKDQGAVRLWNYFN